MNQQDQRNAIVLHRIWENMDYLIFGKYSLVKKENQKPSIKPEYEKYNVVVRMKGDLTPVIPFSVQLDLDNPAKLIVSDVKPDLVFQIASDLTEAGLTEEFLVTV